MSASSTLKSISIAAVFAAALAWPVSAQQPAQSQPPVPAQKIVVGAKVGEAPPTTGGYDSMGRRDPFVSLVAPRRGTTPSAPRTGTGLTSFFVADVTVTGVTVVEGTRMFAILQGPDKQSYVAKVKDRLADGMVKSIDRAGVVLVEFVEPGSFGKPREIRKLLHPADEVIR